VENDVSKLHIPDCLKQSGLRNPNCTITQTEAISFGSTSVLAHFACFQTDISCMLHVLIVNRTYNIKIIDTT